MRHMSPFYSSIISGNKSFAHHFGLALILCPLLDVDSTSVRIPTLRSNHFHVYNSDQIKVFFSFHPYKLWHPQYFELFSHFLQKNHFQKHSLCCTLYSSRKPHSLKLAQTISNSLHWDIELLREHKATQQNLYLSQHTFHNQYFKKGIFPETS